MAHRVSRQRRRRGSHHDGETATTAERVSYPAEDTAAPIALMRPNVGHEFARMAQTAQNVSRKENEAESEAVRRSIAGIAVMRVGTSPTPESSADPSAGPSAGPAAGPDAANPQTVMLRAMFHGSVVQPLQNAHAMLSGSKPNINGAKSQMEIAAQSLGPIVDGARATGDEVQALRAADLTNLIVGHGRLLAAHQGLQMTVGEIAQDSDPGEGVVNARIVAINEGLDNPPQTVPTTGGA